MRYALWGLLSSVGRGEYVEVVAVETRATDNTEEDEEEVVEEEMEEGRGLRIVQEAMSKLFAYAEGGGGTRSNVERGRV